MVFEKELDDRQLKAVELLATGETISSTAKLIGVNRKTITEWKKQDKFKAEMDKQVAELQSNIEKKILSNINPLLDKLIKIALKSKSDKTSLDACIYAINRLAGTPTTRMQDVSDGTDNNNSTVDLDIIKNAIVNVEQKEIVEGEIVDDTGNK